MFGDVFGGLRVLITGDTGFKGAWLVWWLRELGAEVAGVALPPPTDPSLFAQADLAAAITHHMGDIRDPRVLAHALAADRPEVIFHLAAQALVRESYEDPAGTLATNVMGTAHLLGALRTAGQRCAVVVVTSDKCYENREWERGYHENDALGGHDVYSGSKGCAEIVTSSYRRSFFPPERIAEHGVAVASARAGNVIGPGDWARDRIVPDCISALAAGEHIPVRNPGAVRPWQHVLESLSGYLCLAAKLISAEAADYCEAWNFGPEAGTERPVREVVERMVSLWGAGGWQDVSSADAPHEAHQLRLAIDKASARLAWHPVWDFETTVRRTVLGYLRLADSGGDSGQVRALMNEEIQAYATDATGRGLPWAQTGIA